MMITAKLIRSFGFWHKMDDIGLYNEMEYTPLGFIEKFKDALTHDELIYILCRNEFMSNRDIRMFAIWCSREALKLVTNPDPRSIKCLEVSELFAHGNASMLELKEAKLNARIAQEQNKTNPNTWGDLWSSVVLKPNYERSANWSAADAAIFGVSISIEACCRSSRRAVLQHSDSLINERIKPPLDLRSLSKETRIHHRISIIKARAETVRIMESAQLEQLKTYLN